MSDYGYEVTWMDGRVELFRPLEFLGTSDGHLHMQLDTGGDRTHFPLATIRSWRGVYLPPPPPRCDSVHVDTAGRIFQCDQPAGHDGEHSETAGCRSRIWP